MGLFSWLFGRKHVSSSKERSSELLEDTEFGIVKRRYNSDEYFPLLEQIQDCQSDKQYTKMLECCRKSLPLIGEFVSDTKEEFGSFDISSIPAIEVGCRYWAAMSDIKQLEEVKGVVESIAELKEGWLDVVESSFVDAELSERIKTYIKDNPGFPQNKMGKVLGVSGRDTARIIRTLTNLGLIRREKAGKTYELYLDR